MIEKKLIEALEPVLDIVDALEKRLGDLEQKPVAPGADGAAGRDGADADPALVAKRLVEDAEFLSRVKGEAGPNGEAGAPGADGAPGRDGVDADPALVAKQLSENEGFIALLRAKDGLDGVGIKSLEMAEEGKLSFVLTNDQTVDVELPRGEKGEPGLPGADGLGIETKAWAPGVYREGVFVTAEIGRVYKALRDTVSEPGKGEDWQRVGNSGFAWTGVKQEGRDYQNGDLYIDGGSTFLWWNGKGRMFTQRGPKGEAGARGKDGLDGSSIIAVKADYSGFHFALSNGDVVSAELDGVVEVVKEITQAATLNWLEAEYQNIEKEGGTPLRSFRGGYVPNETYSKGDVVFTNKTLYVAREKTSASYFDEAVWRRIISSGGGGGIGGSTGGGGFPNPVLQALNMNSFSITNLKPPASPLDAATKDYVDKNGGNISKAAVDTRQFLAFAGVTDGAKLDAMFVGGRVPVNGDLVFIGYDKTAADNSKAGIYRYSGNWARVVDLSNGVPQTLDDLLDVVAVAPTANQVLSYNAVTKKWESQDNNAAAVIKHFAATAISAAGTAGQTAEQILLAKYATLAGSAPRAGVFAVIENGAGNDGKFNGVYYYDGTNWTKFARELSASGAGGLVKALVADPDPNLITTPQPLGTAQYTVENNAKEIKIVDGAGNWNTIYSETNIRNLIAQSRSFKGTVVEKGATVVGTSPLDVLPATTALTATDVGTYYVFVGTGGHVIAASEIGGTVSNVDGTVLSPGDWIQVANLGTTVTPKYDYVVIHGDALSMARARAVFGLNLWADGAFERGSIVRYQPTPNAGIHYYVASGDVITGDTAPGAVPPPGVSATPIVVTVTAVTGGKEYNMTVTGGPASGGGVLNVTFDVDATPGADIQTAVITAGMTADQVADAIVAGWSNPQTTATKGAAGVVNVKVKNVADSITTFTINAASLGTINATAGTNKWVDITPYAALSSLPDCYELAKATDGQVPSWSVANRRWEPTTPSQPLVYMGTGVWDASKIASRPDNLGFPADTLPAPTVYGPQAGDLYINLSSGQVTSFTGPAPSSRNTATFTGGTLSPTLDVTQSSIAKLTDVDVATAAPKDGEVLTYDLATTKWLPKKIATTLGDLTDVTEAPASTIGNILVADGTGLWTEQANPSYTKVEVDTKISNILTGIAHDIAVKDILNSPPLNPVEGDAYIIGTAPLLGWLGHANEVAYFDAGAWIFTPPQVNEAHLVEALQSIWAWGAPPGGVGASRWVKIANTGAAAGATAKHGVGEIIPWIADTYPDDYLECRGQIVAITAYNDLYTVIGNKYNGLTGADGVSTFALPDLRGYFLRGVGANGGEGAPGIVQGHTTARPTTPFTGTTSSDGAHIHGLRTGRYANFGTGGGARAVNNLDGNDYEVFLGNTLSAGAHTHNVTISGGGDAETRPKSFSVRWLIRYKAIDGGAMGPRGQNGVGVPAIAAGDDKKIMTVVAGVAAWAAPAVTLPNGTAVGQKLEWNGTTWVPMADKVVIGEMKNEDKGAQTFFALTSSPKTSLVFTATIRPDADSGVWPQFIMQRSGTWVDFSSHRVSAMWLSNTSDNKVAGGDAATWGANSSGLYNFGTNLKGAQWYTVKAEVNIFKTHTEISVNAKGMDASGVYRDCTVTLVYDVAYNDIDYIGYKTGTASQMNATVVWQ